MRAVRRAIVFLGIVALGLGVGTILAPDMAARLDVSGAFENDYLLIVPVGVVAVTVVLGALAVRSVRGVDQATPPDPEGVPTADVPGAEFDRIVGGGLWTAPAARRQHDTFRDRLLEAALRTVMRAEQCSRADARRRVETGTWTDDPVAAAFLAPDGARGQAWGTARAAVKSVLSGELPLQRRARRTALAIERVNRGDRS